MNAFLVATMIDLPIVTITISAIIIIILYEIINSWCVTKVNKPYSHCMSVKSNLILDSYSIMIISKYFDTIHDYINIVKCCKEYANTIERFHYNPIPFKNEKEREIFNNIEEFHLYYKKENKTNYEKEEEKGVMNKVFLFKSSKVRNELENNKLGLTSIRKDLRIKRIVHWNNEDITISNGYYLLRIVVFGHTEAGKGSIIQMFTESTFLSSPNVLTLVVSSIINVSQ